MQSQFTRRNRENTGKLSASEKLSAIALYQSGVSSITLSKQFGVASSSIRSLLRTRGLSIRTRGQARRKYYCEEDYFFSIDTEPKAYWLGFLAADGCISRSSKSNETMIALSLADYDGEHIQRFLGAIQSDYPIRTRIRKDPCANQNYICVYSTVMAESLMSHGVVPRKTFALTWPTTIPNDLLRHYIRGVFDGDGCSHITKNGNPIWYLTGNLPLLEGCRDFLCESIGSKSGSLYRLKNGHTGILAFGNRQHIGHIYRLMYEGASIWLPRKRGKFAPIYDHLVSPS